MNRQRSLHDEIEDSNVECTLIDGNILFIYIQYIYILNIYLYRIYGDIDAYIQIYRCVNNVHVYTYHSFGNKTLALFMFRR